MTAQVASAIRESKLRKLRDDFRYFCRANLRIRDKTGNIVPLLLNPAQERLTSVMLRQLDERGLVRVLVPKARQVGASTCCVAFLYWLAMVLKDGLSVYSLAHEDDAAKNFSAMVARFGQHEPVPMRRVLRQAEHKREWDNGSVWEFGTASTPTGGRGQTRQAIHFSEVAFWKHAESHTSGSLQGLGSEPGTYALWESTARGPVGAWYETYRAAKAGEEDLEIVFLAWWLTPEYTADGSGFVPEETAPSDLIPSEKEYQAKHGLTAAQMAWRRLKIREFNARGMDGPLEFSLEYPADADEAFAMSGTLSFISPKLVEAARRRPQIPLPHQHYGLEVGLDPAPSHGRASTAFIRRNGPAAHGIERWRGLEVEEIVRKVTEIFIAEDFQRIGIDTTEFEGQHIARLLRQVPGLSSRVVDVNFGTTPDDRLRYLNKRAEIWSRMATWLRDPQCSIPNEIIAPGQPNLASELVAPERVLNEHKLAQVESKKSMAARNVPSPDGADALACTFHRTELVHGQSYSGFHVAPMGGELADSPYRAPRGRVPEVGPDDYHVAPFGGM